MCRELGQHRRRCRLNRNTGSDRTSVVIYTGVEPLSHARDLETPNTPLFRRSGPRGSPIFRVGKGPELRPD